MVEGEGSGAGGEITEGSRCAVTRDIKVGGRLAFSRGEVVLIEAVSPHSRNPDYRYAARSARLDRRYLLRESDLTELPAPGDERLREEGAPVETPRNTRPRSETRSAGREARKVRRRLPVIVGVILFLATAVAAAYVLIFVVLNDSEAESARDYMDAGDSVLQWLRIDSEAAGIGFSTLIGRLQSGEIETYARYEEESAQLKALFQELLDGAEEALGWYKKILELEGVDDYAQYAEVRLDQVRSSMEGVRGYVLLLESISRILADTEATGKTNVKAIEQEIATVGQQIFEARTMAEEHKKRADSIKAEKGLER